MKKIIFTILLTILIIKFDIYSYSLNLEELKKSDTFKVAMLNRYAVSNSSK